MCCMFWAAIGLAGQCLVRQGLAPPVLSRGRAASSREHHGSCGQQPRRGHACRSPWACGRVWGHVILGVSALPSRGCVHKEGALSAMGGGGGWARGGLAGTEGGGSAPSGAPLAPASPEGVLFGWRPPRGEAAGHHHPVPCAVGSWSHRRLAAGRRFPHSPLTASILPLQHHGSGRGLGLATTGLGGVWPALQLQQHPLTHSQARTPVPCRCTNLGPETRPRLPQPSTLSSHACGASTQHLCFPGPQDPQSCLPHSPSV